MTEQQERHPTDIAGSPFRESQIRQDERKIMLNKAIKMFDNGNYNGQTVRKMLTDLFNNRGKQE